MANVRPHFHPARAFKGVFVSDIFQEVEEEYRRQQMADLWKKYRILIIAGVSVIIGGVALYQGWHYWRTSLVEQSSRDFEKAAELISVIANDKAKRDEAAKQLEKLANEGTSGYSLAAKLQAAALLSDFGNDKQAIAIYDEVANSGGDSVFRDYAQIRAALLTVDKATLDETKKRVEAIAQGNGTWRVLAMELLAYSSWRAGKTAEALKLYAEIQKVESVPNGSKRRALEMESLINSGMKVSDVKIPTRTGIPDASVLQPAMPEGGTAPLLLQPSTPAPAAPGAPATPTAPAPTTPAQPPTP
jgi:hypothetical protein